MVKISLKLVIFVSVVCLQNSLTEAMSVNTSIGVPGTPYAINSTISTITLSWDPPTDGSPLVHNYRIQSKIIGTDSEWESSLYFTDNNSTVFKVEGLFPGSIYVFRVGANYENGVQGPWSDQTTPIGTIGTLEEWPDNVTIDEEGPPTQVVVQTQRPFTDDVTTVNGQKDVGKPSDPSEPRPPYVKDGHKRDAMTISTPIGIFIFATLAFNFWFCRCGQHNCKKQWTTLRRTLYNH